MARSILLLLLFFAANEASAQSLSLPESPSRTEASDRQIPPTSTDPGLRFVAVLSTALAVNSLSLLAFTVPNVHPLAVYGISAFSAVFMSTWVSGLVGHALGGPELFADELILGALVSVATAGIWLLGIWFENPRLERGELSGIAAALTMGFPSLVIPIFYEVAVSQHRYSRGSPDRERPREPPQSERFFPSASVSPTHVVLGVQFVI